MISESQSSTNATRSADGALHPVRGIELVVVERRCLAHHPISSDRSLTIGRSLDCDVVLQDAATSRRHAVVHVTGGLSIEDLGSHNGTRLRGAALVPRQRTPLRVGDSVQIGATTLLVRHSTRLSGGRKNEEPAHASGAPALVPGDGRMRAVHELIERVAPSMATVLVIGETGVGKELVAEAIHRASGARSKSPLVRINCAALPGSLFESELFGYERGAFTNASSGKPGLLETANRGTVFLDEIGELPLAAQPKLLRALEAREVTRVGGVQARPLDVRFVAATNRDLRAEIARGTFREDLYFRLNTVSIAVPPLRERTTEIEPLARHFADAFCRQLGRPNLTVGPSALQRLLDYPWPGNVRELRNVVEWAVLHAEDSIIEARHLPSTLESRGHCATTAAIPRIDIPAREPKRPELWSDAQQAERHRIVDGLAACNGNQTRAAQWLNMPRRTLVAKLATYGIPRPRKVSN